MKAFIDFAEKNIAVKDQSRSRGRANPMNVPLATALKLRDLLDEAKAAAGDTIHGERIQLVIDDLQPREDVIAAYELKDAELAAARANAPTATLVSSSDLSEAPSYTLKAARGSEAPSAETTFQVAWDENALLLDIVCQEPEMDKLVVSDAVNTGDYVAVSIETPNHTYYHMEINPDGEMLEGNPQQGWSSLAEVKTEKGDDFWRVHLRIPVVDMLEAESDPNHRVSGSKPTAQDPWFFNVGRARVVGLEDRELLMFSQTGSGWHVPPKFAKLEGE